MEMNVQFESPAALPSAKSPLYRLTRRPCPSHSRTGYFGGEKNLFHMPKNKRGFLGCPVRSL